MKYTFLLKFLSNFKPKRTKNLMVTLNKVNSEIQKKKKQKNYIGK